MLQKKNLLLALLSLVILVTASGLLLAKDKVETVDLWAYGSSADALEQLAPAFTSQNPNIKIQVTKIGWDEMYPKILAAATAGSGGPDLASVNLGNGVFSFASKKGVLADLTKSFQPHAKDFTDWAVSGVTYKGKTYAIPWDVGPYTMFYRADLYAAAGVDVNSIKTWDDFIAAGKKLTKGDQYATFFPYTSYEMGNWYYEPMLVQAGGNIFDKKGNVIVDKDPQALAVLQKLKDMVDSGIGVNATPWSPAWNSAIKNGKIATLFAGGWFSGLLKSTAPETEGKWKVAVPPSFRPGCTGNFGGSALVIPQAATHKKAALKFALYALATKEG
ncbi:MAG: ABC transporter substrate-binding protein, partial [Bacteroidota bacterium]